MSTIDVPNTKRAKAQAKGKYGSIGKVIDDLDDRLGVAKGGRTFMDKIFPDHWSFMLGEIALYSFVVLLVTGVFLTLYYIPSSAVATYHGAYLPLDGVQGHRGVSLDGQPLLRGARRTLDAPDAPLGV